MKSSDEQVAALLKALGHPVRIWLIRRLAMGDACVCELLAELNIAQPMLSQHLQVLRHKGVVSTRREANRVVYSLRHPRYGDLVDLLGDLPMRAGHQA